MNQQLIWSAATLLVCLIAFSDIVESRNIVKRQIDDIDPLNDEFDEDDAYRDKRKVEAHVDAGIGVKNAVLGFVFNKLNSFLDQKTAWIDQLDHTNIAKNKAAGIEPPKDPITSLSGIISGVIGQKLTAAAPLLNVVTSKLTSGSGGGGGAFKGLGALFGGSSGGGGQVALPLPAGGAQAGVGFNIGASAGGSGYGGQVGGGYSAYGGP